MYHRTQIKLRVRPDAGCNHRWKAAPVQAKAWLTSVVRSELDRIERQRMISRMDPVGSSEENQRLDWATARAWFQLASKGLHAELSAHDRRTVLNEGSTETDIVDLERPATAGDTAAVDTLMGVVALPRPEA